MQLVIHPGAHFTEEDRLFQCLQQNKKEFAKQGICVPPPGRYRKLIKQTLEALKTAPPLPDARDVLLDAIVDDDSANRVLLSNAHFFGAPRVAVRNGMFYPLAPERLMQLRRLFPYDEIEIFMAMRNPATILPVLFRESPRQEIHQYLEVNDPCLMRWSETFYAIREAVPDISLTVWCNEDAPLIWGQIIQEMAGVDQRFEVKGCYDLLASIMSPEGMQRFQAYLASHPELNEIQKRRVIAAFLDKFALEEEIVEELDVPGWDEMLIQDLTDVYDEDMLEVGRIPCVNFITP